MPRIIPISRNGVSHILATTAGDQPPPCPDCGDTPAVLNEIVHDDDIAELWYPECGHEFLSAAPTLGETLTERRTA